MNEDVKQAEKDMWAAVTEVERTQNFLTVSASAFHSLKDKLYAYMHKAGSMKTYVLVLKDTNEVTVVRARNYEDAQVQFTFAASWMGDFDDDDCVKKQLEPALKAGKAWVYWFTDEQMLEGISFANGRMVIDECGLEEKGDLQMVVDGRELNSRSRLDVVVEEQL